MLPHATPCYPILPHATCLHLSPYVCYERLTYENHIIAPFYTVIRLLCLYTLYIHYVIPYNSLLTIPYYCTGWLLIECMLLHTTQPGLPAPLYWLPSVPTRAARPTSKHTVWVSLVVAAAWTGSGSCLDFVSLPLYYVLIYGYNVWNIWKICKCILKIPKPSLAKNPI